MPPLTASDDELLAIAEGRAAVDLASFRKVRVRGDDARAWLHDLVTTDVASLVPGASRRTLLLDATGHIRADLQVACDGDGFWLFQAPDQPDHIRSALAPYVLSSAVSLDDLTDERGLIALLGSAGAHDGFRPSCLGPGGDVIGSSGSTLLPPERAFVGADAAEVWRIRRGRARMGTDFDGRSIPAEAGLDETIDETKGCFLGQESVARVRNLGHPPRVLRHMVADGPIDAGSSVVDEAGDEVGVVTSAATHVGGGTVLLASIRWGAGKRLLDAREGRDLAPVGSSD
jgi:tRNA-modifying protein YgfZ